MEVLPEPFLLLNDALGIYLPQKFASVFDDRDKRVTGVTADEWTVLEAGPDHDDYWDVWDDVVKDAIITDDVGVKYHLHQEGNCWLIPTGMEWNEEKDQWDWPEKTND